MTLLRVSGGTRIAVMAVIAMLMGLEAASLRRWTLSRQKWRPLDVVVADDEEAAERRFFDRWRAMRGADFDPLAMIAARRLRPEVLRTTPFRRRHSRRHRRPVSSTRVQAVTAAIIDYGSGNLHSAAKAFECAARNMEGSEKIIVTRDPDVVFRADRVVLPGVGAFADCRKGLDALDGMVEAMTEAVRDKARPFLGICVGCS